MDQTEYNQISAYHLNKTIPNTCVDNLSRNAFVRKSKRYQFSVLESFAAVRYNIDKLRDICRSLTSLCTVCAYRRLVTIEGKRIVQISEKRKTTCGALGLEPKEKLPFIVRCFFNRSTKGTD